MILCVEDRISLFKLQKQKEKAFGGPSSLYTSDIYSGHIKNRHLATDYFPCQSA